MNFNWAELIEIVISMIKECQSQERRDLSDEVVALARHPVRLRLHLRKALRQQGLGGLRLISAVGEAARRIDDIPDYEIRECCASYWQETLQSMLTPENLDSQG